MESGDRPKGIAGTRACEVQVESQNRTQNDKVTAIGDEALHGAKDADQYEEAHKTAVMQQGWRAWRSLRIV
jgi:hypothetical protein